MLIKHSIMKKLFFKDSTLAELDELFGLRQIEDCPSLNQWLNIPQNLNQQELNTTYHLQKSLVKNVLFWNEQELSLHFIGPLFSIIDFSEPYRFNFFAQRPISAIINDTELYGKPDGMIASGYRQPLLPFFCFHEYKKEIDTSGDPIGQCLAAMLVGQSLSKQPQQTMYGCVVVGRDWFFMTLVDKYYCLSKGHNATQNDLLQIVQILKELKQIILQQTTKF